MRKTKQPWEILTGVRGLDPKLYKEAQKAADRLGIKRYELINQALKEKLDTLAK